MAGCAMQSLDNGPVCQSTLNHHGYNRAVSVSRMIQVQENTEVIVRRRTRRRAVGWAIVLVWAAVCYQLGLLASDHMRFRVNDLSVIPGAGTIMRDADGVYYHVKNNGMAREIYPDLASADYNKPCYECALVTGEQMSQTNAFCASSTKSELPALDFELPCETWAPLGELHKAVGFAIFIIPLILFGLIRSLRNRSRVGQSPA